MDDLISRQARRLRGVKMSEREIERILQECDNEEEAEKAIEEYLTFWDDTCDDFEEKEYV